MKKENKIERIKEYINENLERDRENLEDCKRCGGLNSYASGMYGGAVDAYNDLLKFIEKIESEK